MILLIIKTGRENQHDESNQRVWMIVMMIKRAKVEQRVQLRKAARTKTVMMIESLLERSLQRRVLIQMMIIKRVQGNSQQRNERTMMMTMILNQRRSSQRNLMMTTMIRQARSQQRKMTTKRNQLKDKTMTMMTNQLERNQQRELQTQMMMVKRKALENNQ